MIKFKIKAKGQAQKVSALMRDPARLWVVGHKV